MDAKQIRLMVREVVGLAVAQAIAESGFRFHPGSLTLKRTAAEAEQTIHLAPYVRPRYAPGALVVLQPTFIIEFGAIAPFLERDGYPGSGTSLVQPVADGGPAKQWEIRSVADAPVAAADFARDISERILPLLDELCSPEALSRAYASHDPRVTWTTGAFASVVAFHALNGDLDEARRIALERFRTHGLVMSFPKVARLLES